MSKPKFFATLTKKNIPIRQINVFEAYTLKNMGEIETSNYELATLYDLFLKEKVFPVVRKGQIATFSYYSGKGPQSESTDEYHFTSLRLLYMKVFENKKNFTIQESKDFYEQCRLEKQVKFQNKNKKTDNINVIHIKTKNNLKLHRITVENGRWYFVDIFFELEETYPYSYYYKWNAGLALEFNTTNKTSGKKSKDLRESGYTIFESTVREPKHMSIPDKINDEQLFETLAGELSKTHEKNYRLVGDFLGDVKTKPEFQERYIKMSNFEKQCAEMEKTLCKLTEEKALKQECLRKIIEEKEVQAKLAEEERIKLEEYKRENEYYKRLEEDNASLTSKNSSLTSKNSSLTSKNSSLTSENSSLTSKNSSLVSDNTNLVIKNSKLANSNNQFKIATLIIVFLLALFIVKSFII